MNVTKIELCNRVAKRLERESGLEIKPVVETFLDEVIEAMAEGYRIEIRGFGCFKPIVKKERIGRNPRTGDIVPIPAYTAPNFKFSKDAQKIFEFKITNNKNHKQILGRPR